MTAGTNVFQRVPQFPEPLPVSARFFGNPDSVAEEVISYEAGIRGDLGEGWSFDVAGFYSEL